MSEPTADSKKRFHPIKPRRYHAALAVIIVDQHGSLLLPTARRSADIHLGYRSAQKRRKAPIGHRGRRAGTLQRFLGLLRGDDKLLKACSVKSIRIKACERPRIYERAEST